MKICHFKNMKKKEEYIKLIRKELLKERPVWEFIRNVSRIAKLQDTAYRDKIERHDVQGLLMDYLLDLKYWKNRRKKILTPPIKK